MATLTWSEAVNKSGFEQKAGKKVLNDTMERSYTRDQARQWKWRKHTQSPYWEAVPTWWMLRTRIVEVHLSSSISPALPQCNIQQTLLCRVNALNLSLWADKLINIIFCSINVSIFTSWYVVLLNSFFPKFESCFFKLKYIQIFGFFKQKFNVSYYSILCQYRLFVLLFYS